ncbi:MAG TPA: hypothetical protein VFW11_20125 [Cyclobacteriaceae bacterium]|nr:hypothetical protein [Cyclobacteriaceae bacterium]
MKVSSYSRILIVLHIFFSWSCILQKEEDGFVEIAQTADPRNVADLYYSYDNAAFFPVVDTLFLSRSEGVYLRLEGGRLQQFTAKIDGNTIVEKSDGSSFAINPQGLSYGSHQLELIQVIKSGTGSFADKLDAESATYTATFVLIIDDYVYNPNMSIEATNGTIELKWNAYARGDFKAYEIRKYESRTGSNDPYRKLIVTDQQQVVLQDTTHAGGACTYVFLVDCGAKVYRSENYPVNFPYEPDMHLTKLAGGKARLTWNKTQFFNNISSIKVSATASGVSIFNADYLPADQTSVEMDYNVLFGQVTNFTIELSGKVDRYEFPTDRISVSKALTYWTEISPFSDILYNQREDAYYITLASNPGGVYRLDKDLHVTDTLLFETFSFTESFNLIQSPDGNHIYVLNDFWVHELGQNPLHIEQSYFTGDTFAPSIEQNFAATNNNFILFRNRSAVKVVDFRGRRTLVSVSPATASSISADGKYFVNGADLYEFDGNVFIPASTLPYTDIQFLHFIDSDDRLFIATSDKAIVYDHINQAVIAEYTFSTNQYAHPEFNDLTMQYIVRGVGLVVLDVTTGEQKNIGVFDSYNTTIEGQYLFSNSGYGSKEY